MHVSLVEERPDVLPERARLARCSLVPGRLAHENEALRSARAGRIEEVAVARDGVGPLETSTQLPPDVVAQERRRPRASRKRSLLEAENEDHVEVPGPRALVIENGDASRRGAVRRYARPFQRRDDVLRVDSNAGVRESAQLVERAFCRSVCARVDAGVVDRRGRVEPPCVSHHDVREATRCSNSVVLVSERDECRNGRTTEALALLLDAGRVGDGTAPEAPLHEVDGTTLEPRERRAQEREQIAPPATEPGVPKHRGERAAERRVPEASSMLDRVRHVKLREGRLERRAPAVGGLAHNGDTLGSHPATQQRCELARKQLDGAACSCPLEEADGTVEWRSWFRVVREELPLEMSQRGRPGARRCARKLLDRATPESCEILDRPLESLERRAPGLVRDGHHNLGSRCERFQERPLGTGQILEPVREHGGTRPCVEIPAQALDGSSPQTVAIAKPQFTEFLAIGRNEAREVAVEHRCIHETRLELPDRLEQRVREACGIRGGA